MLEILLIRHGQTDWNRDRKIMGEHPIGLNSEGRGQVETLATRLAPLKIEGLYVSPLKRTMESAEILNRRWGLPLETHEDLKEIEYGEWVGKTFQEIRTHPDYIEYYKHPDRCVGGTGESLEQVQRRGVRFLEALRGSRTGGKLAVVTHADWIKCVVLHYLKMPLSQLFQLRIDNASISYLTFEGKRERVIAVNHCVDFEGLFVPRGPL